MRHPHTSLVSALCLVALTGWIACGEPTREEKLRSATDKLEEVESRLERARSTLEAREQTLESAREQFEEARDEVRGLEREREKARQAVGEFATDDVLFRTIQKRLLEDEDFERVAIKVAVRGGMVTLSGEVPDSGLKERAGEVAGEVPGVHGVRNDIRVVKEEAKPDPAPAPSAPAAPEPASPGAES